MALYQLGSKGDEVKRIQQALLERGFYGGPIDGSYGDGTASAVRKYQASAGTATDGIVGPGTWKLLIGGGAAPVPAPAVAGATPLELRCLGLTGAFETSRGLPDCFGGLSGDFDGQGLSYGVCQWNFGQGTLQALLLKVYAKNPVAITGVFGGDLAEKLRAAISGGRDGALAFARSIQDPARKTIQDPWKGMFLALGRTAECQEAQREQASGLFQDALALCAEYGLWSERACALMFDIKVQNGSISKAVKALIEADFERLPSGLSREQAEVERMKIVASRRAEASSPAWVAAVKARKLCCAEGRGVVNGVSHDLEAQFGIRLVAAEPLAAIAAAPVRRAA